MNLLRYTDEFLDHLAAQGYSTRTIKSYTAHFKGFREFLRDAPEDPRAFQDMVDRMSQKYKPQSVKAKWYALVSFYKYLLRRKVVAVDPTPEVVIPEIPARLPKALDSDVVADILDDCRTLKGFHGLRARAVLELGYAAMARESDLLGLKLADIDLDKRTLRVIGKGNREAILMFGAEAKEALVAYLEERTKYARPDVENVFIKANGRPLATLYRIVSQHSQHGSHVFFRHSPATHMVEEGADISVVSEMMRHDSIRTTMIYTKLTDKKLRRQYERFHPRA